MKDFVREMPGPARKERDSVDLSLWYGRGGGNGVR